MFTKLPFETVVFIWFEVTTGKAATIAFFTVPFLRKLQYGITTAICWRTRSGVNVVFAVFVTTLSIAEIFMAFRTWGFWSLSNFIYVIVHGSQSIPVEIEIRWSRTFLTQSIFFRRIPTANLVTRSAVEGLVL